MTRVRRACVALSLGLWAVVCAAQETAQETVQDTAEDVAAESAVPLETASDDGSTAVDGALDENAEEQDETTAEGGATEAGAADAAQVIPEIVPLDELFVPSQNIRADEPVTFPVDF